MDNQEKEKKICVDKAKELANDEEDFGYQNFPERSSGKMGFSSKQGEKEFTL